MSNLNIPQRKVCPRPGCGVRHIPGSLEEKNCQRKMSQSKNTPPRGDLHDARKDILHDRSLAPYLEGEESYRKQINDSIKDEDHIRSSQLTQILTYYDNEKNRPHHTMNTIDLSSVKGKIAIDCDDTIGGFGDDMRQAMAIRDGLSVEESLLRYPPNPKGNVYDWYPDADNPAEAFYRDFKDCEDRGLLYHSQPVRVGAKDTINWLHKATGGNVIFLTARPEKFNDVTRSWLRESVGIDFNPSVFHSTKKEEVDMYDLLIDDNASHIKNVSSHDAPHGPRRVVAATHPFNEKEIEENDYVTKAWSWFDVRRIFRDN